MKYLKQFVVASSWMAIAPFLHGVNKIKDKNYTYYDYSIQVPFFFGIYNIISLIFAEFFGLSMRARLLLLSLVTYIGTVIQVKINKRYKFTKEEWNKYYIRVFLKHFVLWNVVVYYLEKYI